MGFGQGLSGLKAQSQKLDVIGNNIANSGTVGFKSSTVSFADVYASSRVGLGTQVTAVNQNFGVGNISSSGGQFDIAIDGASGLFRIVNASGAVSYTRNGEFFPNKDGYLVNAQGNYLTGFVVDKTTGEYGLSPEPIRIPTGNIDARATGSNVANNPESGLMARLNLDADADILTTPPPQFPADPTEPQVVNPNSFNYSVPVTVYDSLGREHQVTQYYRKTADNTWDIYYQLNSEPPIATPHTVTFSEGGKVHDGTFPEGAPVPDTTLYTLNLTPGGGAAPLVIPVNYGGSTQFGGGEYNYTFRQDGYATGEYASMDIAADGTIMANYTNGQLSEVGYLVLAQFPNLQGLQPIGGNAWQQTATSGEPSLGRPGSNGMALIKGQSLEESNVDMGTELVNMIITQRAYQANAQTITTQSEILQTLLNIR